MVDLERLAIQARRVAERGRVLMALRVAWLVLPLGAASIAAGGDAMLCLCLAVTLFAAAALLRWWSRSGVDAVRLGLAMGTIPLIAALLLRCSGVECAPAGQITAAEVVCILAGAVAGLGVALRCRRTRDWRTWSLATAIASLTAGLGCVGLGFGSLLATASLVVVSAGVWVPIQTRPT